MPTKENMLWTSPDTKIPDDPYFNEWQDLTDAILIRADLTGADLRGADLWNVRAMSATLTRAKLGDARIYGLNLDGANVDGVKWDNCPTGQRLWRSSRSDPGTCRPY